MMDVYEGEGLFFEDHSERHPTGMDMIGPVLDDLAACIMITSHQAF